MAIVSIFKDRLQGQKLQNGLKNGRQLLEGGSTGGVVGGIVAVIIVIVLAVTVFLFYRRRKKLQYQKLQNEPNSFEYKSLLKSIHSLNPAENQIKSGVMRDMSSDNSETINPNKFDNLKSNHFKAYHLNSVYQSHGHLATREPKLRIENNAYSMVPQGEENGTTIKPSKSNVFNFLNTGSLFVNNERQGSPDKNRNNNGLLHSVNKFTNGLFNNGQQAMQPPPSDGYHVTSYSQLGALKHIEGTHNQEEDFKESLSVMKQKLEYLQSQRQQLETRSNTNNVNNSYRDQKHLLLQGYNKQEPQQRDNPFSHFTDFSTAVASGNNQFQGQNRQSINNQIYNPPRYNPSVDNSYNRNVDNSCNYQNRNYDYGNNYQNRNIDNSNNYQNRNIDNSNNYQNRNIDNSTTYQNQNSQNNNTYPYSNNYNSNNSQANGAQPPQAFDPSQQNIIGRTQQSTSPANSREFSPFYQATKNSINSNESNQSAKFFNNAPHSNSNQQQKIISPNQFSNSRTLGRTSSGSGQFFNQNNQSLNRGSQEQQSPFVKSFKQQQQYVRKDPSSNSLMDFKSQQGGVGTNKESYKVNFSQIQQQPKKEIDLIQLDYVKSSESKTNSKEANQDLLQNHISNKNDKTDGKGSSDYSLKEIVSLIDERLDSSKRADQYYDQNPLNSDQFASNTTNQESSQAVPLNQSSYTRDSQKFRDPGSLLYQTIDEEDQSSHQTSKKDDQSNSKVNQKSANDLADQGKFVANSIGISEGQGIAMGGLQKSKSRKLVEEKQGGAAVTQQDVGVNITSQRKSSGAKDKPMDTKDFKQEKPTNEASQLSQSSSQNKLKVLNTEEIPMDQSPVSYSVTNLDKALQKPQIDSDQRSSEEFLSPTDTPKGQDAIGFDKIDLSPSDIVRTSSKIFNQDFKKSDQSSTLFKQGSMDINNDVLKAKNSTEKKFFKAKFSDDKDKKSSNQSIQKNSTEVQKYSTESSRKNSQDALPKPQPSVGNSLQASRTPSQEPSKVNSQQDLLATPKNLDGGSQQDLLPVSKGSGVQDPGLGNRSDSQSKLDQSLPDIHGDPTLSLLDSISNFNNFQTPENLKGKEERRDSESNSAFSLNNNGPQAFIASNSVSQSSSVTSSQKIKPKDQLQKSNSNSQNRQRSVNEKVFSPGHSQNQVQDLLLPTDMGKGPKQEATGETVPEPSFAQNLPEVSFNQSLDGQKSEGESKKFFERSNTLQKQISKSVANQDLQKDDKNILKAIMNQKRLNSELEETDDVSSKIDNNKNQLMSNYSFQKDGSGNLGNLFQRVGQSEEKGGGGDGGQDNSRMDMFSNNDKLPQIKVRTSADKKQDKENSILGLLGGDKDEKNQTPKSSKSDDSFKQMTPVMTPPSFSVADRGYGSSGIDFAGEQKLQSIYLPEPIEEDVVNSSINRSQSSMEPYNVIEGKDQTQGISVGEYAASFTDTKGARRGHYFGNGGMERNGQGILNALSLKNPNDMEGYKKKIQQQKSMAVTLPSIEDPITESKSSGSGGTSNKQQGGRGLRKMMTFSKKKNEELLKK